MFLRKLLSVKSFEYMTYGQQYISVVVALALVSTQDTKFRIYDNTTVPLHDSAGKQTGTYTFSGHFIWIHFNVFAGAWAFLSMTGLYIYAFLKKHWHGYHTIAVHFFNWALFLAGFILIGANLYDKSFCNSVPPKVKWTFCLMPKVVLASEISLWILFCVTLGYEIYLKRSSILARKASDHNPSTAKQGEMVGAQDLGNGEAAKIETA